MSEFEQDEIERYFPGFTVYDAETGERVYADGVIEDEAVIDGFWLSEDGELFVDGVCGGEIFDVPKEGKYVISFRDGTYMRW